MATMSPELRMTRARTRLLLQQPWFGSLAMRLAIQQETSIPTFDVDGVTLRYNPAFLATLSDDELIGVLAHEVMHCALLHVFRRNNRDPKEWNIAADYAINQILTDSGLTLPDSALLDPQFREMSAEQVYAKRGSQGNPPPQQGSGKPQATGTMSDAPQAGSGESDGAPDPNGKSQANANGNGPSNGNDPGNGAASDVPDMTEQDWAIAAEQASMAARKAGKLPASANRSIKQSHCDVADWKSILREFVTNTYPSDYSWSHPNRRHIANGIYLPGVVKENTGELVIAVDTSGSVDGAMLAAFANEISGIMRETNPERVRVVYCDAQVQHTEVFGPGDEIELHAKGGGGTQFNPVFDWVNHQVENEGLQPKALIYLTDLDCYDSPIEPAYPVLWATPLWVNKEGIFGSTVRIETDGR